MRHILRVFMPLIAIIVFVNLYFAHPDGIQSVGNYPIWLNDTLGNHTDQTSGLCYIGVNGSIKTFLCADDIGKINRIVIDESRNPPQPVITEIAYSKEVRDLFYKFKKKDMEDIYLDKTNNRILISLEGHESSSLDPEIYKQKEGIYEMTFNNDIMTFDTILTAKRLKLPKEIYAHTYDNIGFEGFAVTENYFFLGLENYQRDGTEFTDSTLLYVLNRKTNELKTISTREFKISTICGLYAADDYNLYGIDRNRRSMFYINFNEDFSVNSCEIKEMALSIPKHRDINSIIGIAPESITFDASGNIYVAIDPWRDFYKPDITDRKKLSQDELNNFYEGIPIMYKFKNTFN
ncbi:MAG TPA: hypothetical protein PKC91_02315 [Ignavibacteria bacterium]|nr:hypothetical protein [Ignavibacteria bacterium]